VGMRPRRKWREVDLVGARLVGARNLTQDQLDAANGDDRTQLPDGLTRPTHWPKARRRYNRMTLGALPGRPARLGRTSKSAHPSAGGTTGSTGDGQVKGRAPCG
jgi:hypothetical protein